MSPLDRLLQEEQRDARLPSIVGAGVHDGAVVWAGSAGSVTGRPDGSAPDADTQFRLGSITKTFVAVQIMRLRDEGLVDLTAPASEYVDDPSLRRVSVAQLLSHTSGLQAETDGPWWERAPGGSWSDLVESGPSTRLTTGSAFHYSNVGYAVLGEIIGQVRGRDWSEVVRDEILEPLGMTRTTTRPTGSAAPGLAVHPRADLLHVEPEHDAGALAPAGQLWSSIDDLARWVAFLAGDTADVLAAETLTEMLRPVAINDLPGQPWAAAHALGWQVWNVDGVRYAGHGGSMPGFLALVRVNLETRNGVAVLTNATSGLRPTFAGRLLDALDDAAPAPIDPWHADPSQADDLDLAGPWFWGTYEYQLALEPDRVLRLGEPGVGRGSRFRPAGGDWWVGTDGYFSGEPLHVERTASGAPARIVLASFVFTRTPYEPGSDVPGGLDSRGWH